MVTMYTGPEPGRNKDNRPPIRRVSYSPPKSSLGWWREKAACLGKPSQWWFADGGSRQEGLERAEAIRICASCPVRDECLELGMRNEYGIWGGLVPAQRDMLRRMRRWDYQNNR